MEQPIPFPLFDEADLLQLLKNNELDYDEFILPRQQFLRRHMYLVNPTRLRPIYRNLQTVRNHKERTSAYIAIRQLHEVYELLEKIAKLDNHIHAIYTEINDIFFIMHKQKTTLERKLGILRKNPVKHEKRMMELKKSYDNSFRSLRETLKAQRDVLAIEEELRTSLLKELKGSMDKEKKGR